MTEKGNPAAANSGAERDRVNEPSHSASSSPSTKQLSSVIAPRGRLLSKRRYYLHVLDNGSELRFARPPEHLPSFEVKIIRRRGQFIDLIDHFAGLPGAIARTGRWTEFRPFPTSHQHWRRPHDWQQFADIPGWGV